MATSRGSASGGATTASIAASDSDLASAGAEFGELLRQLHAMCARNSYEWLEGTGISFAQLKVLKAIAANPGASGAEIAIETQSTPQAVAQVLGRLIDCGTVERSSRKGRAMAHNLTPQGQRQLTAATKAMTQMHAETLTSLDPDEVSALLGAMRKLRTHLAD